MKAAADYLSWTIRRFAQVHVFHRFSDPPNPRQTSLIRMASTGRQRPSLRTVSKTAEDLDNAEMAVKEEDVSKQSISLLPPEIHLAIADYLIYPDALSLKHSSRHFYSIIDTGIELKIDWLMERRRLHLECPNDRRCDLGSDLRFCRGSVPYVFLASSHWS